LRVPVVRRFFPRVPLILHVPHLLLFLAFFKVYRGFPFRSVKSLTFFSTLNLPFYQNRFLLIFFFLERTTSFELVPLLTHHAYPMLVLFPGPFAFSLVRSAPTFISPSQPPTFAVSRPGAGLAVRIPPVFHVSLELVIFPRDTQRPFSQVLSPPTGDGWFSVSVLGVSPRGRRLAPPNMFYLSILPLFFVPPSPYFCVRSLPVSLRLSSPHRGFFPFFDFPLFLFSPAPLSSELIFF